MLTDTTAILKQFEPIETLYKEILTGNNGRDAEKVSKFYMLCRSCLSRISGENGVFVQQMDSEMEKKYSYINGSPVIPAYVPRVHGIVQALKDEVAAGYMSTLRELAHAEVFSDFLEQADYLLNEGFKDAAAVIIGGVLENHLRQLCVKQGIDLEATNNRGQMKPKMGDTLNQDLKSAGVYNVTRQKQITAWQGLRNDAAHGDYGKYTADQVRLFLDGVRDFTITHPA